MKSTDGDIGYDLTHGECLAFQLIRNVLRGFYGPEEKTETEDLKIKEKTETEDHKIYRKCPRCDSMATFGRIMCRRPPAVTIRTLGCSDCENTFSPAEVQKICIYCRSRRGWECFGCGLPSYCEWCSMQNGIGTIGRPDEPPQALYRGYEIDGEGPVHCWKCQDCKKKFVLCDSDVCKEKIKQVHHCNDPSANGREIIHSEDSDDSDDSDDSNSEPSDGFGDDSDESDRSNESDE